MGTTRTHFIRLSLLLSAILFAVPVANAQTSSTSNQKEVAAVGNSKTKDAAAVNVPVYKDYRGIRIGMTAEEVRSKVDGLRKNKTQDFLISDKETAQIYYDAQGKVIAISIDYFGDNSNTPTPEVVLGVKLHAKPDGSMYQLNRYPAAGYWVSYNRTAGDKPIITITLQKM